jgi:phytanoyl-CoA hydroxylase
LAGEQERVVWKSEWRRTPRWTLTEKIEKMKEEDRQLFFENGYVVIKHAVEDRELNPLREVIEKVVDKKINDLYARGLIRNMHKELPLSTRWLEVNREYPTHEQMWVRQVFSRAIYDLGIHPGIVDVIEALIGSEIRFNEDNGCLQFAPGSHKLELSPEMNQRVPRAGGKVGEQAGRTHELDEKCVSLLMEKGDMVVFDKFAFHRSLPNTTNEVRWNVDLRYSHSEQSFEWNRLGDEIDVKYPSFIVKSLTDPDKETTWEQFLEKFLSTTSRYDENGNLL